jgi:diacylglycerol kinase (ATP)
MRAAAIFGLGCSAENLRPFQTDATIDWHFGLPSAELSFSELSLADQAEVVLVFGGDGTIHSHLRQLVNLNVPVLIVPAGSGNDFARALGLRCVRDSVQAWQRFCVGQDNVRAIDLGVITPMEDASRVPSSGAQGGSAPCEGRQYFCSVAGVGLDSEVTRRANSLPRWVRAHGGYAMALAPAIVRFAPVAMKILSRDEGGTWSTRSNRPTMLAAFANTPLYGGGMRIAPRAQMDDGQLDVCVIGGINRFKLACMFPAVYFGRHLRIREVDYFQAGRLRVETETPLDIYADGEYVCRTPAEITIEHGALKVLSPQLRC